MKKNVPIVLVVSLFMVVAFTLMSKPSVANTNTLDNATSINNVSFTSIEQVSTTPEPIVDEQNQVYKNLNIQVKEISASVKVDKITAIEKAKQNFTNLTTVNHIDARLVSFTNNGLKKLPNSDIVLKDLPAWLIKIDGMHIERHGVGKRADANSTTEPVRVLTQVYVVIDANTGEEIQMFSYK